MSELDALMFNVSDLSRNVLPAQTFFVLVHPDNNLPPKVDVTGRLMVSIYIHI